MAEEKAISPASKDIQVLQDYYDLMHEESLDALEIKLDDRHIKLVRATLLRQAPVVVHGPVRSTGSKPEVPSPSAAPVEKQDGIQSPLAGVFYRASSPTTPPFVKEGDVVEPGQTLCIVEAMKVMNEIKAETRCRIVKIPAENSRPVTAGQTLFLTEPV
jgi:acetyl-CoA carboxylase biotin carboxyl carrier protein